MKANELQAIQNQLQNIKEQELSSSSSSASKGGTPIPTPGPTPATTPGPSSIPPVSRVNPAFMIFNDLVLSGLVKKDQEPIPGSKPVYSLVFHKPNMYHQQVVSALIVL